MKKFKLVVFIGDFPIYEAVISLNESQQQKVMKEAIENVNGFGKTELEAIICDLKPEEQERLESESITDVAQTNPDFVIMAGLRTRCYSLFQGFGDFNDNMTEETSDLTIVSSTHHLQNYSWTCERVD